MRILQLLAALLIVACQNHEEITPLPPPVAQDPVETPAPEIKAVEPAIAIDNENYLYGSFGDMPYRLLVPRGYDSTRRYPVHVFLHGIGERGSDNEKQLTLGGSYFQVDSIRSRYSTFVLFPQCAESNYWFDGKITASVKGLLDSLVSEGQVDSERISIGGFSMGAYGTFAMVAENPGYFHTAVAISGDGDERTASKMAKTAWRIFAGKKDMVVPSIRTEKMAEALERAGAAVSFTLYPEADHGSTWLLAFSEHNYFSWLFRDSATPSQPALAAD